MFVAKSLACALLVFSGAQAFSATTPVPLENPAFKDLSGDHLPDGWDAYPSGDGLRTDPDAGGVWIEDSSTSAGLGIAQWVSATPGTRYTLNLDLAGEGGLFAYMTFLPKKPARAKDIEKLSLKNQRVWMKGGGENALSQSISEVAPEGTQLLRVWIYSPSSGTTKVRATKASLTAESFMPVVAPTGAGAIIPEGCLNPNPDFSSLAVDGMPEDWEVYPAATGSDTSVAVTEGGLRLIDQSKKHGVGLSQWIPVEEGKRYIANAQVEGQNGLFLYSVFTSEKPQLKSRYSEVEISQKRDWAKTGKMARVAEVAPRGAKWMRLWLYSASSGTCDVMVKAVTVYSDTSASDAAAYAAGLFDWMDFETGDFSQISTKEGGSREIVSRDVLPPREGQYCYKARLERDQMRTEVTGARSPAYGIARYGWSIYVPEDFDADTFFTICTQWHDYGSGRKYPEDGGAPSHLYISKGHWRMKIRHQGEGQTTDAEQYDLGSLEGDRGQWTDWVFEINHQAPGNGGWAKLYKNDELVVDYKGTTWYEGKDKGPYFKMGLYRGSNKWPGTVERSILYFDAFRMAVGEDTTYEQVAPSTYAPRPE